MNVLLLDSAGGCLSGDSSGALRCAIHWDLTHLAGVDNVLLFILEFILLIFLQSHQQIIYYCSKMIHFHWQPYKSSILQGKRYAFRIFALLKTCYMTPNTSRKSCHVKVISTFLDNNRRNEHIWIFDKNVSIHSFISASLPIKPACNTSLGRYPGGILTGCPNHLNWLLL